MMVPLAATVRFWFAPPLHGHSSTLVPGAVWLLHTSRHSVAPMVRNSPAEVTENGHGALGRRDRLRPVERAFALPHAPRHTR